MKYVLYYVTYIMHFKIAHFMNWTILQMICKMECTLTEIKQDDVLLWITLAAFSQFFSLTICVVNF